MNETSASGKDTGVAVGRRPIFDAARHLWGYELFCVGDYPEGFSGIPGKQEVGVNIAGSAYIGLQQILSRKKKIILDFSEKSLLDQVPYALPSILAAVKIEEAILSHPSMAKVLERLKKDGYLIAIGTYSGNRSLLPFYKLADILCVDTRGMDHSTMSAALSVIERDAFQLFASRVENGGVYRLCQDLGFALFEGSYFKSPETITVRKLTSNQVSRFNLLKAIQTEEPDMEEIARAIQADASISFRMMAYLNSAAFGFPRKVKSIPHAISLLGWRKMRNWLRVILLADVEGESESSDWFLLSAQRGRFLERVAQISDFWGFDPESMHLLGLFSLLDIMLGTPMPEIVTYLPLDNKIKAALCREPNNEYLPLLELTRFLEEGRWEDAESLMQRLNLDPATCRAEFQEAINWATELTTTGMEGKDGREAS